MSVEAFETLTLPSHEESSGDQPDAWTEGQSEPPADEEIIVSFE